MQLIQSFNEADEDSQNQHPRMDEECQVVKLKGYVCSQDDMSLNGNYDIMKGSKRTVEKCDCHINFPNSIFSCIGIVVKKRILEEYRIIAFTSKLSSSTFLCHNSQQVGLA